MSEQYKLSDNRVCKKSHSTPIVLHSITNSNSYKKSVEQPDPPKEVVALERNKIERFRNAVEDCDE